MCDGQKLKATIPKQLHMFPRVLGVECYAYHDSGSGIYYHPEKMRRMLQARNPSDVQFKTTVLSFIQRFQGEPILHKTRIYSCTFQLGKTRPPIQICTQEVADGMANLDTFLNSQDVLLGENWNGLQDVLSDGSIQPYIPDSDEKVYFEASNINTIPGLGQEAFYLCKTKTDICPPSKRTTVKIFPL